MTSREARWAGGATDRFWAERVAASQRCRLIVVRLSVKVRGKTEYVARHALVLQSHEPPSLAFVHVEMLELISIQEFEDCPCSFILRGTAFERAFLPDDRRDLTRRQQISRSR